MRARVVAGVLALLLAALVAATYDGAAWPGRDGGEPTSQTRSGGADETRRDHEGGPREAAPPDVPTPRVAPTWVRPVALGVLLALVLAATASVLLSVRLRLLRRRLRGDLPLREGATAPPPVEVEPDPESVEEALAGTLAGLGEGEPRNAVVACWIRLEELAVARGLERHEADTPAEFVARALEAQGLDARALERLADLYREARFSRHALTEAHRDEARTCLEQLRRVSA